MGMRCEVRTQKLYWIVYKNYDQEWVGYARHLLTCTQVKHCLFKVCKSAWGGRLNMVFCSIELARETFIVLSTIHKILQVVPQNHCNFTMGLQASSSMC